MYQNYAYRRVVIGVWLSLQTRRILIQIIVQCECDMLILPILSKSVSSNTSLAFMTGRGINERLAHCEGIALCSNNFHLTAHSELVFKLVM
jgi:hypothetical protein